MKNAVKKSLVWSLLLIGVYSYAIDDAPLKTARLESAGEDCFALYVKTFTSDVQLKIKDVYGNEVYSESLEKGNYYKRKYDMSALPKGTYYINVSDANSVKLYIVEDDKVALVEEVGKVALEKRRALLKALTI